MLLRHRKPHAHLGGMGIASDYLLSLLEDGFLLLSSPIQRNVAHIGKLHFPCFSHLKILLSSILYILSQIHRIPLLLQFLSGTMPLLSNALAAGTKMGHEYHFPGPPYTLPLYTTKGHGAQIPKEYGY